MGIGKTDEKSSTTGATDPAVLSAYQTLLGRAQNLSNQPLQTYGGPLVAGLTDTQNQAISNISGAQNTAAPYYGMATGEVLGGTQPISLTPYNSATLGTYLSPYTQNVTDTTRNLINEQNAEQQNQLKGNIAAAGAWGGDRSAILQSELARNQDLAGNATLANIQNQGYTNAQNQFNTAQGQSLQAQQANVQNAQAAGYELGTLGTAQQNSSLNAANALLGAGTLQQQVAQEQLNVPYEQYLQQQAYPYQSLQFLASLLPGVASATGMTTNSSSYQPFNFGSLIGLGSAYAKGGRTRLVSGGVPDVSAGYIPAISSVGTLQGPGGGDGGMGGGQYRGKSSGNVLDNIGSAVEGVTNFLGLEKGGRARLADGGMDDDATFQNILDRTAEGPPPRTDGAMTLADTPPEWRGTATNYAPAPESPAWDDGTPVAKGGSETLSSPPAGRVVWQAPKQDTDWGHVLLSGLAGFASTGNLGKGLKAGMEDYDAEMDPHPEVDHTGSTVMVKYGVPGKPGQLIDTGIPTEAALNARAMNDYRRANSQATYQAREDAIAQRAQAAQDSAQAREQANEDRRLYQQGMLSIRGDIASQGRYSQPVPGIGMGEDGKQVPGVYTTNLKTGQPEFHPGITLTAKPTAAQQGLTPAQALSNAQKDYDRLYPVPKADPSNPGQPLAPRPVPPEGMGQWLQNRKSWYLQGGHQNAPAAPTAAPAQAAAAAAPRTVVPQRPASVPAGAMFSPSRNQWRDQSGRIYNAAGQPIQ